MYTFIQLITLAVTVHLCTAIPANLVGIQPNTPENIEKLKNLGPDDHPQSLSGQFEGDIVLNQQQLDFINAAQANPYAVQIDPTRKWPDGIVPYELAPGNFTSEDIAEIELALYNIECYTCLRFPRRTSEADYVSVTSYGNGCSSYVGLEGGPQNLNLAKGCVYFTGVIHEFLHAVGFFHMQSAADRDNYVRILWDNIVPGMEHNFGKIPATMISQYGVPYDFTSVMHYGAKDFSKNGEPTMESVTGNIIRPTNTWSLWDIQRINNVYCGGREIVCRP